MKNVLSLLVSFLITGLLSSCAFAMGQRRCDAPVLPVRPLTIVCVSNERGSAICFDPVHNQNIEISSKNLICTTPSDYQAQEEWIKAILEASHGSP